MYPPRILLVDDEPAVLLTYNLILTQRGYQVATARSTQEAKQQLENGRFDLVLCDLTLETERSGFEIIAFARSCQPSIATILLTGLATPDVAEETAALKITVLYKPVDVHEMLATVANLTRARSAG